MTRFKINNHKRTQIENNIEKFFEENYFDVQGINAGFKPIDEAYLARILTKIAVGSATVWWSILEVKEFIVLRKRSRL